MQTQQYGRDANGAHRALEAREVFGSEDTLHPGVHYLSKTAKEFYIGGKLEALSRLEHYDFLDLRCKQPPSLPPPQPPPLPSFGSPR